MCGAIQIANTVFLLVLSTLSNFLPHFRLNAKKNAHRFVNFQYTVPLSKLRKQWCNTDAMTTLVLVFNATKCQRVCIDTNLCNERPKLLLKLLAKFNLAIFRLRFVCICVCVCMLSACAIRNRVECMWMNNGIKSWKLKCAPRILDKMHEFLWKMKTLQKKKTRGE